MMDIVDATAVLMAAQVQAAAGAGVAVEIEILLYIKNAEHFCSAHNPLKPHTSNTPHMIIILN